MKTLEDMKIQLDRIEKNQFDLVAAADRLWQSHAALEIKIESGLRGTADGVALAIAELRKELLGTPQRGRKHSYRTDDGEELGTCDLVHRPHPRNCCGKAWRPLPKHKNRASHRTNKVRAVPKKPLPRKKK